MDPLPLFSLPKILRVPLAQNYLNKKQMTVRPFFGMLRGIFMRTWNGKSWKAAQL